MSDIPVVSVRKMRECDAATIKKLGDSKILMHRAGEAVVEEMEKEGVLQKFFTKAGEKKVVDGQFGFTGTPKVEQKKIAIVCGSGNNAGDGYVIAKLLHLRGIAVELFLLEERFSEDGRYYFKQCRELNIPFRVLAYGGASTDFEDNPVIVDCMYGTGFHGKLSQNVLNVIKKINRNNSYVVSVDINSGMNGDSGLMMVSEEGLDDGFKSTSKESTDSDLEATCVESDLTVSIGFFKKAHVREDCKRFMKKLVNVNIGIEYVENSHEVWFYK